MLFHNHVFNKLSNCSKSSIYPNNLSVCIQIVYKNTEYVNGLKF